VFLSLLERNILPAPREIAGEVLFALKNFEQKATAPCQKVEYLTKLTKIFLARTCNLWGRHARNTPN
jgi:hypothetical protein